MFFQLSFYSGFKGFQYHTGALVVMVYEMGDMI